MEADFTRFRQHLTTSVDMISTAIDCAKSAFKMNGLAQLLRKSSDFLIYTQGKAKGLGCSTMHNRRKTWQRMT
jgi:hypothetical protein